MLEASPSTHGERQQVARTGAVRGSGRWGLAGWERLALGGVLLVAAFCDFFWLAQIGYGNTYYAATVKSMLLSWHNFFFVSFDPGGFVTADKPPVAFWIQTISAKLFGFSGLSLMLPQAIAGVLSVAVLYALVRRVFGPVAGLLAGLALALTPVNVVSNRDNIVDSLLVLTVLLAAWATVYAVERGSLRWLLLAAVLVGVGYNIKMLEAYLVVPALGLVYLLGAPLRWRTRLAHLALALVVLLAVSLSWSVAVDLTPATQRPYVGSSSTNSEINLAFGYNGLQRLTGLFNRGGAAPRSTSSNTSTPTGFTAGETGLPGPFRLLNDALGGQISWLLALGVIGLLATGWHMRPRPRTTSAEAITPAEGAAELEGVTIVEAEVVSDWRQPIWWRATLRSLGSQRLDQRQHAFVLWGVWFLTQAIFFSVAGFFHSYYLVMLAPAICALAGIGLVELWHDYRQAGWRGWLLPLALLATALVQAKLIAPYAGYSQWLTPLVVVGAVLAAAALVALRLANQPDAAPMLAEPVLAAERAWAQLPFAAARSITLATTLTAVGMLALLLAPTAWSAASIANAGNSQVPSAGPARPTAAFGGGGPAAFMSGGPSGRGQGATPGETSVNSGLQAYLLAHQGSTRYLVAVTSAMSASPYILATGKPVMALGGFLGSDPILTTSDLARLVAQGQVRYFLLSSGGAGRGALTPAQIEQLPAQLQQRIEAGGGQFPGGGFGGPGGSGGGPAGPGGNSALTSWVTANCTVVPQSAYSASAASGTAGQAGGNVGFGGGQQLYDCGALAQG